jgi:hypothetical protein
VSTRSKAAGDPAKKSFDDTEAFVEILAGVKSPDMALEVQKEFTKSGFENFVGGVRKKSKTIAAISPGNTSSRSKRAHQSLHDPRSDP